MKTQATDSTGGSTDFKSRLYEHYSSEHVQISTESANLVQSQRSPYLRRMIAQCMPADKSAAILDVGCGYGSLLSALRSTGYTDLHGVDISAEQVALARHLGFEQVSCEGALEFLGGTANSTYDVVIAFDVIEHLSRTELFSIVNEIRRVLKPGGRFVVHVPNGDGLFFGSILFGDLTHELAFTRSTLNQLAEACGLRLARTFEDVPPVHGLFSLARRIVWSIGTFPLRVLSMAETGQGLRTRPLSRNMLAILERP